MSSWKCPDESQNVAARKPPRELPAPSAALAGAGAAVQSLCSSPLPACVSVQVPVSPTATAESGKMGRACGPRKETATAGSWSHGGQPVTLRGQKGPGTALQSLG